LPQRLLENRKRVAQLAVLVMILAAFVRIYHIDWSFSSNGIDEGIMLERSLMANRGYSLYAQLPVDQAPLAFLVGALFDGDVVALRSLTATISLLAIAACMYATKRIEGNIAMLFTGMLLAVDFAFVRESRLFSLDALSASFLAFSIAAFVQYLQGHSKCALLLSGFLAGVSAAMKLLGGIALLGMILYIVIEAKRSKATSRNLLRESGILILSSIAPLVVLMLVLGPSDVFQGMVLDQTRRGFDTFLKLSILAFFAVNAAYALPLVFARSMWPTGPEIRFLLTLSFVLLALMIVEPLVFLHHMVLLSPGLAILSGILLSRIYDAKKRDYHTESLQNVHEKKAYRKISVFSLFAAGLLLSAGLEAYGLASQEEPIQSEAAWWLERITDDGDYVISGDPLICAYAGRMTPPGVVNVAYRVHPDLTLDDVDWAIDHYDVPVVIVCYRLNDMDGLLQLLQTHHYERPGVLMFEETEKGSLDLFKEGIGPLSFWVDQGTMWRVQEISGEPT